MYPTCELEVNDRKGHDEQTIVYIEGFLVLSNIKELAIHTLIGSVCGLAAVFRVIQILYKSTIYGSYPISLSWMANKL